MLALSTKHAIKALFYLSRVPHDDFLQVVQLSLKTGVPGPYLSKLIKQLAIQGLIETRRGKSGGVRLWKNKRPITFFDVCVALKDPIVRQSCFLSNANCGRGRHCEMHTNWTKVKAELVDYLRKSEIRKFPSNANRN